MKKYNFLNSNVWLAYLAACFLVTILVPAQARRINEPAVKGIYYESKVPDTIDLAESAKLGLQYFTAITREEYNYEMPLTIAFEPRDKGPSINMHGNALGACQCKAVETMCFERLMTGSELGLDKEAKMLTMMVSMFGEKGLHWVAGSPDKPWLNIPEPFVMVHGQGRILRAMIAWYQYTENPAWLERVNGLIDGIDKIVEHKDDYAYFPVYGRYEGEYIRSCYVKDGWGNKVEPTHEKFGEEGSLFNHQGHVPGGMATSYFFSGNDKALRLSGELIRFLTKPKFWADFEGGEYPGVVGAEHAHWQGHWHGNINTLRAILDYAVVTNNTRLMLFVRDGYEWARRKNLGRIGYFDEQGCALGRLIGLAVKLSYHGVGDYWEDIDQYIRNHGIEMQIIPEDMDHLYRMAGENLNEKTKPILALNIGGFSGGPDKHNSTLCCSPHGNMGIFYAWDGALRYQDGIARVNLLINRASTWLDVDSYLPFEGKVVLKNKKAQSVFVRIPLWVDKSALHSQVGKRKVKNDWFDQYLRFENLKAKDIITIEFPMVEKTERWTLHGTTRICRFKGNTLIEISPPIHPAAYCRRQRFLDDKAPLKKVTRYVTEKMLIW
jgi:hypothetical protein